MVLTREWLMIRINWYTFFVFYFSIAVLVFVLTTQFLMYFLNTEVFQNAITIYKFLPTSLISFFVRSPFFTHFYLIFFFFAGNNYDKHGLVSFFFSFSFNDTYRLQLFRYLFFSRPKKKSSKNFCLKKKKIRTFNWKFLVKTMEKY